MKAPLLPPRLARMKVRATRYLRVEQCWHYARWPALLVGLWGIAACFHLPQSLPDSLHLVVELAGFGGLAGWAIWHIRKLPPPTHTQIDQRIAVDSGLPFRPLEALGDSPALADSLTEAQRRRAGKLWAVHRQRLLASLDDLHLRLPRLFPHWPGQVVALLLGLAFIIAAGFAGSQAGLRLKAGFLPGHDDDSMPLPNIQAWIDPPGYAPGPPVFLGPETRLPDPLPEGALLHATIESPAGRPSLHGIGNTANTYRVNNGWRAETTLNHSGTVSLYVRGRRLGHWPVHIKADTPPDIRWTGKAGADSQGWKTHFPWSLAQPYGVSELDIRLRPIIPPGQKPDKGLEQTIRLPLDKNPRHASGVTELDLSASPFAGLEVAGTLCAHSGLGRQACSASQVFRLGHRPFHDATSRALLALRLRLASHQDSQRQTARALGLLAELPQPDDIALPLTLLQRAARTIPPDSLSGQLWFLALYVEDRAQSGQNIAASMLHVRSLQNSVEQHLITLGKHPSPPPLQEQEKLHEELDALKAALDGHMALIFQHASQNGLVMPMPQGNGMPWHHLAGQIQSEALAGDTTQAQEHLQAMVEPAEQMRQAAIPDLQALAASMQSQAEARNQRMALRDLIHQETELLNHAQKRLSNEQPAPDDASRHKDVSQMSTAELLSQLGMAPPAGAEHSAATSPLDPDAVLRHADERRADHGMQYALRQLAHTLSQRSETLTQKKMPNLLKAEQDMAPALHSLADRQEESSVKAIQKVLNDLSQARQDMKKNQSEASKNSKGRLGFIPPPSAGNPEDQDGGTGLSSEDDPNSGPDDDGQEDSKQPKDQDPLGRKMDDSPQSDAHIPEHDSNRAHDIERELQRRASDRTRPQSELDYLNRLLAPLRQPH